MSFPVGAMRSDFWRYAVIYMHGGIYGDIDTWCKRPVQQWLPAEKPSEWENYEPENWYCVGRMALMNLRVSHHLYICRERFPARISRETSRLRNHGVIMVIMGA
jgi:mannosyltransferase OCH1-like enzyme